MTSYTPPFRLTFSGTTLDLPKRKWADKILAAESITDSKVKANENTKVHMDEGLDRIV